jgi:hypothetical protein
MTSKLPRPGDYSLQEWKYAGLHQPTTVRLSQKNYLDKVKFIHQIGVLHPIDILRNLKIQVK